MEEVGIDESKSPPDLAALRVRVSAKEDTLRQLKLVKMYKGKWAKDDLTDRGVEWKSLAQRAFLELFDKHKKGAYPDMTVEKFLEHLKIDPEFIGYNVQDEVFE